MDENLKKIKEIILQTAKEMNIEIDKIILFGSRARGDYKEDSDYDLLIVTKEKLETKRILSLSSEIEDKIIETFDKPADIIVISKEEFEKYKNWKSLVIGVAAEEGINL
ncbi:MAG: nucleotidyltransferase domain-containing protein, partial [Candidatus Aenigmatarchaeota archaeon]